MNPNQEKVVPRLTIGLAPGAPLEAAGQDERRYAVRNPIVRALLGRLTRSIRAAAGPVTGVVADIGGGEGIGIERLGLAADLIVDIDYRIDKLRLVRARLPTLKAVCADAGMIPLPDASVDLTLCLDVLEHLISPGVAISELARITRGRVVVSVPWEPFFRVGNLSRGKNIARLGNDMEHVQSFSRAALGRALAEHFAEIEVRTSFPWLVAVARHQRV